MIAVDQREGLVREAHEVMLATWPGIQVERACLYETCALAVVLAIRRRFVVMLQAGFAAWPVLTPEDDDGVCSTHFQFGEGGPGAGFMARGMNPYHVWLAHREPDTIIDPTTGTWPKAAATFGIKWRGPEPPPFLWVTQPELRDLEDRYRLGIRYQATREACEAVARASIDGDVYKRIAITMGIADGSRGAR